MAEEQKTQQPTEKEAGYGARTHDAGTKGHPGEAERPIKVTMMGAGSAFTPPG